MTQDCCLLGCDAVYFQATFYVFKEPFPSIFRVQEGRQQVPGKGWRLFTKLHAITSHNPYSYLWRSVNSEVWLNLYYFIAIGCNSPELQRRVDAACLRKINDTVGRNIRTRFALDFLFSFRQIQGYYLKYSHYHFLPYPSNSLHTNCPITWSHSLSCWESSNKHPV
jgi:hypothetical protein